MALSGAERFALEFARQELEARGASDPLKHFQPHAKQQAFIDSVLTPQFYENWFVASNRGGKTDAGCKCDAEFARFGLEPMKPAVGSLMIWDRATTGWVVGPDYGTLTQVILPKLLDWPTIHVPPGSAHAPFIPQREIESWDAQGQTCKLKNGSLMRFKSNEQSTVRFAAAGVDYVHFDEEPPYRNYEEVTLRVEAGRRLRIYGTCTLLPPEGQIGGVSWLYEKLIRPWQHGKRDIGLFGAAIWDNPHILPEEIERLTTRYPQGTPQYRIRLGGEWLPGIGGNQCYHRYDARIHLKPQPEPVWHAPLCWFWDFNVNPFCSGVGQYLDKVFHVYRIFELEDASIEGMVEAFRHAYPTHGNEIWIYGDATGHSRHVQSPGTTAKSNYTLIQNAMRDYPQAAKLCLPSANPHRKDRVNAANAALKDLQGRSWVEIDPEYCQPLVLDLEQVITDNEGGPKKTTSPKDPYFYRTHSSDGWSYWVHYVRPVALEAQRTPPPQEYAVTTPSVFQRPGVAPQRAASGWGGRR